MMKLIRRLYFKLFRTYKRLDLKFCRYAEADVLIKQNPELWVIAKEEDNNDVYGWVWIESRIRIYE